MRAYVKISEEDELPSANVKIDSRFVSSCSCNLCGGKIWK